MQDLKCKSWVDDEDKTQNNLSPNISSCFSFIGKFNSFLCVIFLSGSMCSTWKYRLCKSYNQASIVGKSLSLMSTLEEVWELLEVMGVFEEVSKVVPLWCIFKHGSHGNMLWRSLQESLVVKKISYMYGQRSLENLVRKPQRCSHEDQSCLRKTRVNDIAN